MPKKRKHSHKKNSKNDSNYTKHVVAFVALVAIVAVILWLTSKSGETRVPEGVAATVNGQNILVSEIDEQYERVPANYQGFITKETILNQTINEVLLLQAAENAGVSVTSDDIQAEIAMAMNSAGITDDQLDERLAEQGIDRSFLEELYRKQLTINGYLENEVFADVTVSDSEAKEMYDENIHAAHILVETEEEANTIINDLKKVSLNDIEETFKNIAKEKSIDPSAQMNMGDLGEFGKGQMVPEFERAAYALEEYSFTAKPIKTNFGYHVILKLPKTMTYEETADAIKESLSARKKAELVPQFIEDLREKADIEIYYSDSE